MHINFVILFCIAVTLPLTTTEGGFHPNTDSIQVPCVSSYEYNQQFYNPFLNNFNKCFQETVRHNFDHNLQLFLENFKYPYHPYYGSNLFKQNPYQIFHGLTRIPWYNQPAYRMQIPVPPFLPLSTTPLIHDVKNPFLKYPTGNLFSGYVSSDYDNASPYSTKTSSFDQQLYSNNERSTTEKMHGSGTLPQGDKEENGHLSEKYNSKKEFNSGASTSSSLNAPINYVHASKGDIGLYELETKSQQGNHEHGKIVVSVKYGDNEWSKFNFIPYIQPTEPTNEYTDLNIDKTNLFTLNNNNSDNKVTSFKNETSIKKNEVTTEIITSTKQLVTHLVKNTVENSTKESIKTLNDFDGVDTPKYEITSTTANVISSNVLNGTDKLNILDIDNGESEQTSIKSISENMGLDISKSPKLGTGSSVNLTESSTLSNGFYQTSVRSKNSIDETESPASVNTNDVIELSTARSKYYENSSEFLKNVQIPEEMIKHLESSTIANSITENTNVEKLETSLRKVILDHNYLDYTTGELFEKRDSMDGTALENTYDQPFKHTTENYIFKTTVNYAESSAERTSLLASIEGKSSDYNNGSNEKILLSSSKMEDSTKSIRFTTMITANKSDLSSVNTLFRENNLNTETLNSEDNSTKHNSDSLENTTLLNTPVKDNFGIKKETVKGEISNNFDSNILYDFPIFEISTRFRDNDESITTPGYQNFSYMKNTQSGLFKDNHPDKEVLNSTDNVTKYISDNLESTTFLNVPFKDNFEGKKETVEEEIGNDFNSNIYFEFPALEVPTHLKDNDDKSITTPGYQNYNYMKYMQSQATTDMTAFTSKDEYDDYRNLFETEKINLDLDNIRFPTEYIHPRTPNYQNYYNIKNINSQVTTDDSAASTSKDDLIVPHGMEEKGVQISELKHTELKTEKIESTTIYNETPTNLKYRNNHQPVETSIYSNRNEMNFDASYVNNITEAKFNDLNSKPSITDTDNELATSISVNLLNNFDFNTKTYLNTSKESLFTSFSPISTTSEIPINIDFTSNKQTVLQGSDLETKTENDPKSNSSADSLLAKLKELSESMLMTHGLYTEAEITQKSEKKNLIDEHFPFNYAHNVQREGTPNSYNIVNDTGRIITPNNETLHSYVGSTHLTTDKQYKDDIHSRVNNNSKHLVTRRQSDKYEMLPSQKLNLKRKNKCFNCVRLISNKKLYFKCLTKFCSVSTTELNETSNLSSNTGIYNLTDQFTGVSSNYTNNSDIWHSMAHGPNRSVIHDNINTTKNYSNQNFYSTTIHPRLKAMLKNYLKLNLQNKMNKVHKIGVRNKRHSFLSNSHDYENKEEEIVPFKQSDAAAMLELLKQNAERSNHGDNSNARDYQNSYEDGYGRDVLNPKAEGSEEVKEFFNDYYDDGVSILELIATNFTRKYNMNHHKHG